MGIEPPVVKIKFKQLKKFYGKIMDCHLRDSACVQVSKFIRNKNMKITI